MVTTARCSVSPLRHQCKAQHHDRRRSPMRRSLLVLIPVLCAGVLLLPSTARAQATLSGLVQDESGAVLPGVTVEASSPALIEKVRSVATDGAGRYTIVDLRPGAYALSF